MSGENWMMNPSNAFILLSAGVNAYVLWSCAAKKVKKEANKPSLVKPTSTAEVLKVEKNSNSDEKESHKEKEKVIEKEKEVVVPKVIVKEKEEEKKEEKKEKEKKKSKILEVFIKKEKSKEEDEKKEEKKKKEESKKDKKEIKGKEKEKETKKKESKSKSESKSDDEDEKPPEPNSDPRKIWAFKAAKLKCQAICKLHQDKVKGFMPPNCTYTAYDANPDLNRYLDVRCIEETRVILKDHERDYIHASWMKMPASKDKEQDVYITTQGPLPETLTDFWHMVYQEKIAYVLMLCTLFEGGVEKCTLYYPEKLGESLKFGKYEITLTECKEEAVAGTTWNALTVVDTTDSTSEPHIMNHVQVPWWPDQLAPEDARPMITLYKWVKSVNPKGTPICVHCSAGVGRTATFVGIDYATRRIMENPNIEMVDIVREMRGMRFQAVQSHMQFLFLYVALLEYFIEEGVVERTGRIEAFMDQYKRHAQKKLAKRVVQNKKGEQEVAEQKEKEAKEAVKA